MAAKQGTLAQLSATAEETKRAVLSKTGASSWFSNLNTVCTIKSAPPRSPEVLRLLATKAGWLYKRNEQHNWQARYCCVVPHMFLYYFDTKDISGSTPLEYPSYSVQEAWNRAVTNGLDKSKPHEKRTKFPFVSNTPHTDIPAEHDEELVKGGAQPAGIIDLECYSALHRSSENPAILELAGDDTVNPDLRAFYFCCENEAEQEEWNTALLNHRHSAILDEVDAYKQVADGFAQQLQSLHTELDEITQTYDDIQQELYTVRSTNEETRRAVLRSVEECWERRAKPNGTVMSLQHKRNELQNSMDALRHQDTHASVRVLVDYIACAEDVIESLQLQIEQLETNVQNTGRSDQAALDELQATHETTIKQHEREIAQYKQQLEVAKQNADASTKELQDLQKDLSSTKMEVTMLMSQQRNKLATQQQHKKILRNEVIELRRKLEEANSQNSSLSHEYEKLKLQYTQEQSKADLLTRYVDKMENQVQVQQNMMEMMSQAGGSVYGGGTSVYGGGTSVYGGGNSVVYPSSNRSTHSQEFTTPNRRNSNRRLVVHNEADVVLDAMDDDEDEPQGGVSHQRRLNSIMTEYSPSKSQRSSWKPEMDTDNDNKSHVSELTEDRTQREFLSMQKYSSYDLSPSKRQHDLRHRKRVQETIHQKVYGPPTVIIGVKKPNGSTEEAPQPQERLETIGGGGGYNPARRNKNGSVSSSEQTVEAGQKKLSIAQKARLEADRKTTPVRARIVRDLPAPADTARDTHAPPDAVRDSPAPADAAHQQQQDSSHRSERTAPTESLSSSRSTVSIPKQPLRVKAGTIWKRVEAVVLGSSVASDRDDDENSISSGESDPPPKEEPRDEYQYAEEEKKSPDGLSLQERSQLQRNKQLRFLRDQGLIRSDGDLPGGADCGSVASSSASRPFSIKNGSRS